MRVEILGHVVGSSVVGTACSSYALSSGDETVLLDCGPGTLPLLQERDLVRRLGAIVISHMHNDHLLDLVPLAQQRKLCKVFGVPSGWKKPRLLVPEEGGAETLSALSAVWYGERDMFVESFEVEEYGEDDRLVLGGLDVTFWRTRHSVPCFAPRVTDGRATVVYSADSGYAPELADHAEGADLFLCEATFLDPHPVWTRRHGHLTGEEAGRLASLAGVGRLVLIHLGPNPEENAANLRRAKSEFGGTVELARSGQIFRV